MPKTLSRGQITAKSGDNERLLAINELQKVSNSVYRAGPFKVSTSDAGPDVVWTSDAIAEGSLWSVVVQVQGQGTGVQGYFRREALFFRTAGGVATQAGLISSVVTIRSDTNISATISLSGNNVVATVSDTSARAISWSTWVEVRVSS